MELELTNNPCKFCNGKIDEIKFCPMCGRKLNEESR